MKVFLCLFLAIASACAFDLRSTNWIDIAPVVPVLHHPEERIINGEKAVLGQFPYQVGLSIRMTLGSAWCGGSLIAPNWVLTAAHCVASAKSATVYLGSVDRTGGISVQSTAIIVHSGYDKNTINNDIALIKIDPVSMGKDINAVPLALSLSSCSFVGDSAVVSGWGKTADSGSVSNSLMFVDLLISANKVCSDVYGPSPVYAGTICASTSSNYKSTCNGDSGGPLVDQKSGQQIGIVSYGAAAGCTLGYPVAFTNVCHFSAWIKQNTGL